VVGGGGALRAAVLLAVGGGEVGLGGAAAEAHLGAARRHLGHALLGLQGLGPEGRETTVLDEEQRERKREKVRRREGERQREREREAPQKYIPGIYRAKLFKIAETSKW